jgi:hypothetical protein
MKIIANTHATFSPPLMRDDTQMTMTGIAQTIAMGIANNKLKNSMLFSSML